MSSKIVVESFTMDHTKVKAPFVRLCGVLTGPKGDKVYKYDLRFLQPNEEAFPTAAMHGIEHLMAGFFREELEDIIDISPMGCRTGFYLVKFNETSLEDMKQAWIRVLKKIIAAEEIPARNAVQCGNYRDLSLFGAKEYASLVLSRLEQV